MLCIDLDPASSLEANKTVRADAFVEEEDGLKLPWVQSRIGIASFVIRPEVSSWEESGQLFWEKLMMK